MEEMMGESTETQRHCNTDSTKILCPYMEMDVQIVVDGSASVTARNFRTLNKLIAEDLIEDWDISPTAVRVSYIRYSERNHVYELQKEQQEQDKALVQKRVKESEYPGGSRLTGEALRHAFLRFKMFMRKSPDVLKVLIFFTNGETDGRLSETLEGSKEWNEDLGAKVFAVGIGHRWKGGFQKELDRIAGINGRTLRINSYGQEDMKYMLHHITSLLCFESLVARFGTQKKTIVGK